MQWTKSTSSLK